MCALQALWGEYTYQAKTKRIVRLKRGERGRPLFVTMALEPLWRAYAAVLPGAGDHQVCPPSPTPRCPPSRLLFIS